MTPSPELSCRRFRDSSQITSPERSHDTLERHQRNRHHRPILGHRDGQQKPDPVPGRQHAPQVVPITLFSACMSARCSLDVSGRLPMVRRRSTVRFRNGAPAQRNNSNASNGPWGPFRGPSSSHIEPREASICHRSTAFGPTRSAELCEMGGSAMDVLSHPI